MQNVYTFGKDNGKQCKFPSSSGCDSYVVLFVNDEQVMKTETVKSRESYDVNKIFTTAKIPKTATIKIEVWHSKTDDANKDKLILSTEGNVESFLQRPLRTGTEFEKGVNQIETMSFWQDERE